jgi:hypothetical protein
MGNQYNNAAPLGYLPDLYVQPFELRCSQHQIACIQAENLCVRFAAKLWIAFRTSLEAASGSCGILGGFFGTQKTSCNGPARNIRLNKRVTWSFDTFWGLKIREINGNHLTSKGPKDTQNLNSRTNSTAESALFREIWKRHVKCGVDTKLMIVRTAFKLALNFDSIQCLSGQSSKTHQFFSASTPILFRTGSTMAHFERKWQDRAVAPNRSQVRALETTRN